VSEDSSSELYLREGQSKWGQKIVVLSCIWEKDRASGVRRQ